MVSMYKLVYTKQAQRDAKKAASAVFKLKIEELLEIIKKDPFQNPPSYEILLGELAGAFSRRINIQHRLVYQVYEEKKIVKVIRMWTHYN
jgi:Txe/YoeB family toxin of toxin-antitoxin system